jgi:hypothetical protein
LKKKLFAMFVVAALTLTAMSGFTASAAQSAGLGKGNLLWSDNFAANLAGNVPFVTATGGTPGTNASGPILERDTTILRYEQFDGRMTITQEQSGTGASGMQVQFVPEADRPLFSNKQVIVEFEVWVQRNGGNMGLMVGGPGSNASYIRMQVRSNADGDGVWHVQENSADATTTPGGDGWIPVTGPGTPIRHEQGAWKTFSIWINTQTGASELYINGTLTAGVNVNEMYAAGASGGTIGTLWFDAHNAPGNIIRVANVRIYDAVAGGTPLGPAAPGPGPTPTAPPTTPTTPTEQPTTPTTPTAPPTTPTTPTTQPTTPVTPNVPQQPNVVTGDTTTFLFALALGGLLATALLIRRKVKN